MTKEHLMNHYNMSEYQADEAIRMMPAVKRALKTNGIYAQVNSVAKSKMSRYISLYIVHKNKIYCLNWAFGTIFGDRISNKNHEVFISGCGMDMLFEANYRLFCALLPKTKHQPFYRYQSM